MFKPASISEFEPQLFHIGRVLARKAVWTKMKELPENKKTSRTNMDFEALKKAISQLQSRVPVVSEASMPINVIRMLRKGNC